MLRLLVLGKTGQVASSLQTLADKNEIEVKAFGRPDVDITKIETLKSAFDKFEPDLVVNAAAYTGVDNAESEKELAFAVNRDGPANIARLTAKSNIPLIHISTDYVFSGEKIKPYLEDDDVAPTGVYGASKLEGEKKVAELNSAHIILRTAWVYSPYGNNFLKTMLRLAKDREELGVVSDQLGNPTESDDIAGAIIHIAHKLKDDPSYDQFGTYHFCGPQRMSWADFAKAIFAASFILEGPTASVNDISTEQYPTPAKRPANSSLDCTKFITQFGYEQISFKDSVHSVVSRVLDLKT